PLGAGGMGEVFKARDTRLNRFVAIKFLPEAASDLARERFQREAQAIAALNHPNICTLYEAGEQGGQPFLVMELLEGETLFHRLQRGAVPMPQLAQWGAEIADALQTAHARGILHRDLKPANVFITQRGTVKVLDFGLAQFAQEAAVAGAETMTSPGAAPLTQAGTTLGTWAYMSPEQARGEPTDARSDIFSCGVVLYEMAGGQAPFRGRTSADLTAAILMLAPPPPSSLQPAVPAKLDDVIAQCLEKDPDLRFQSAADLRVGLKRLQAPGSTAGPSSSAAAVPVAPAVAKRGMPGWLWPSVLAAVLLAAGALWYLRRGPAPPPTLQFHQLTYTGHVLDAVLSPDGKFLAHVDSTPAGTSLHLVSIASHSDVQIVPPGQGCCQSPSFSPDGSQVYFLQNRQLKSVPVLGGAVANIAELACSGAGFSPDGTQIAFMSDIGKLTLARPDGSQAHVLATEQAGGGFVSDCWNNGPNAYHAPAWSPDGKLIATLLGPATGDMRAQVVNTSNGSIQNFGPALQSPGEDLNWLPDGRGLIFTATIPDSDPPQLWEISYPGGRMTRLTNDLQGYVGASLAANGTLSLVHAAPQASVWVQSKPGGTFQELPGGGASNDGQHGLAWTPGGDLLSVRAFGSQSQIWSQDAQGGHAHALAIPGAPALMQHPVVAPDGQIFFTGSNDGVNGQWNLYSVRSDGSGLRPLLHLQPGQIAGGGMVLVHGGRQIVYLQIEKNTDQHLWIANADGSNPRQLLPDFVLAASLTASSDGNHLLMLRRLGNTVEADLVDLRGSTPTVTPLGDAFQGARNPYAFTPDGRAIVYKHRQGSSDNLWAFPLDGAKPYPLTHFDDLAIPAYDLSRDGRLAVSRRSPNSDVVVATGLGTGH
ncbi:MAG TPA: protein kinase, partial [Terriglobales bacterium]|nr:protein kinase [Terriglobales bacterium]